MDLTWPQVKNLYFRERNKDGSVKLKYMEEKEHGESDVWARYCDRLRIPEEKREEFIKSIRIG